MFTCLSDNSLLGSCLRGLTQNQNEAANQVLWTKCPKTKFCGRVKLLLAVCETVIHFNNGAGARAVLLKTSGFAPGTNMLSAQTHKCQSSVELQKFTWKNKVKKQGKDDIYAW